MVGHVAGDNGVKGGAMVFFRDVGEFVDDYIVYDIFGHKHKAVGEAKAVFEIAATPASRGRSNLYARRPDAHNGGEVLHTGGQVGLGLLPELFYLPFCQRVDVFYANDGNPPIPWRRRLSLSVWPALFRK